MPDTNEKKQTARNHNAKTLTNLRNQSAPIKLKYLEPNISAWCSLVTNR